MTGETIRITCLNKQYMYEGCCSTCQLADTYGYSSHLTREVQKYLNFTSVMVPSNGFGSYRDGKWNGMVGVLLRGEADVSPLDFSPSATRATVIDFGLIFGTDPVVIMSMAPKEMINPFLLLQIFSPELLGVVVVVVATVGCILWLVMKTELAIGGTNNNLPLITLYDTVSSALKIYVYQAGKLWGVDVAGRMISVLLMLCALVFGSLYTGSITSFLAIPNKAAPVNTPEDLVATDMIPAVRSFASAYNFLMPRKNGALGEMRNRMEDYASSQMTSWDFLSRVADGTYALVDTQSSVVGRIQRFELIGQVCKFYKSKSNMYVDLDAFAFQKNSPIKYQFDEVFRRFRSYGLIGQIQKQYYEVACDRSSSSDGPQPMTLEQIQGVFYIFVVGIGLSILGFMLEYMVTIFNSSKD
ncbi:unnamed protein product [Meganyctiphanes norvegica]|uniref:Ionotropic receptor n=1 Tax=Meganyctiphanes norvegica TaxID=48144 RepID=A0AAV2R0H0_MEGNR